MRYRDPIVEVRTVIGLGTIPVCSSRPRRQEGLPRGCPAKFRLGREGGRGCRCRPSASQEHAYQQLDTCTGVYVENCKGMNWGYAGKPRFMSKAAFKSLLGNIDSCVRANRSPEQRSNEKRQNRLSLGVGQMADQHPMGADQPDQHPLQPGA